MNFIINIIILLFLSVILSFIFNYIYKKHYILNPGNIELPNKLYIIEKDYNIKKCYIQIKVSYFNSAPSFIEIILESDKDLRPLNCKVEWVSRYNLKYYNVSKHYYEAKITIKENIEFKYLLEQYYIFYNKNDALNARADLLRDNAKELIDKIK